MRWVCVRVEERLTRLPPAVSGQQAAGGIARPIAIGDVRLASVSTVDRLLPADHWLPASLLWLLVIAP